MSPTQQLFCILRDAGKPLTLQELYDEFTQDRPYTWHAFRNKVSLAYKRGYIRRYARSVYYVPRLTEHSYDNRA